jgi:hypothetical protein
MTQTVLTKTRIQAGTYEGVLETGSAAMPALSATCGDQTLNTLSVTPDEAEPGRWTIRLDIPTATLTDGIQTFTIVDGQSGETLDSFTIVTGTPLEDDLRGEINLLRAELDMLKKAFRRHCVETT